jgi:putative membrane protein (TIGR04086 family)
MKKRTRRTRGFFTWRQLAGAIVGCGIALAGMLLLSLLLYWDKAGEGAIGPVNGVLKVICPFAAGFFALRKASERATVTGAIAGALFECILVAGLSLCMGEAPLSWALAGDCIICIATGMAGAMVKGLLLDKGKK